MWRIFLRSIHRLGRRWHRQFVLFGRFLRAGPAIDHNAGPKVERSMVSENCDRKSDSRRKHIEWIFPLLFAPFSSSCSWLSFILTSLSSISVWAPLKWLLQDSEFSRVQRIGFTKVGTNFETLTSDKGLSNPSCRCDSTDATYLTEVYSWTCAISVLT